jgi:hypothetical protein
MQTRCEDNINKVQSECYDWKKYFNKNIAKSKSLENIYINKNKNVHIWEQVQSSVPKNCLGILKSSFFGQTPKITQNVV